MQNTPNYNLKKPALNDYYDILTHNENMDIIDTALKKVDTDKVNKVQGKGLSTNDYTTSEKTKLTGIEPNANNYTHPANHPYSMITGTPTSLPANGGNADTVNGHTVNSNVPAGAVFTDTVYTHPDNANTRHVSDSEKTTWNDKANGSHTHTAGDILGVTASRIEGIIQDGNMPIIPTSKVSGLAPVATTGNYNDLTNKPAPASGKKYATFVIGTSTSGHTASEVDYLCDGVADDVEINQAIQALPSGGGKIVIREGTYNITATIAVNKNNVTIEGTGRSTVLNKSNESTLHVILISKDYNVMTNLFIADLKDFIGPSSGILISGSNNIIASNMLAAHYSGINVHGVGNVITNNLCKDNTEGIACKGINQTVTNNTCIRNDIYGIFCNGGNNTITGNTCDVHCYGISCNGSNNTIVGNTCVRGNGLPTDYPSSCQPIQLLMNSKNNLVADNNIMGKTIENKGTNNTIINNKSS